MSFNTITEGTDTYNSIGNGTYLKSTVGLNDPQEGFKVTPGRKANANAPVNASITYFIEKDVTINGVVQRKRMSESTQVSVPFGFTSTEVDTGYTKLANVVTSAFMTRLLLGES